MKTSHQFLHAVLTTLSMSAMTAASAADLPPPNPTRNVYFGDLHLHTSMSFDAFTMKTNTLPEDSYRFARGEPVNYLGQTAQRRAPLDFLAVTDHSEYLGALRAAADQKGAFAATDWPKRLAATDPKLLRETMMKLAAPFFGVGPPVAELNTPELIHSGWQHQINAAEKYYKPGKFTTFVAYEWSSIPNAANLHRNVIFRGPKYPERPFSSLDSQHPEDLWAFLDNNRRNGIDALAIPHNSNVSDGLMFDYTDSSGKPITRDYAEARMRNEVDVEVAQAKGTSETRPELSPNDEFSGFELINHLLASPRTGRLDGSYVRQAYARGLEIESRIGVNPFKYGLIGATDFHTGISSTEEFNFFGSAGVSDSSQNPAALLSGADTGVGEPSVKIANGGLTGVWAEQNSREAIFDALRRKEVFATSGNRISVRLFVGWNYPADLFGRKDWIKTAYAGGVPMGGDLPPASASRAPRFLLQAVKDPDAGNLDRIQIVKVWFKDGKGHEKVFDAVWAGDRKPDAKTGKLPPVGDTVDVSTATYSNTIGAAELSGVWEDPDFDASAPATYYARVLEIPTPRWTTYLSVRSHLPLSDLVPPSIQERAWTSPVWYRPG